ncbi:unnamed protein product [Ambrosiozyma monospora]|uniref:Unnamed protein product n=1 Tax=Ambrosiozyma monospora TaxID=43982 RepID=A0ACB5TZW5_AMBMO|nr:unnamed protein product [Ambrosiozyma monospora]
MPSRPTNSIIITDKHLLRTENADLLNDLLNTIQSFLPKDEEMLISILKSFNRIILTFKQIANSELVYKILSKENIKCNFSLKNNPHPNAKDDCNSAGYYNSNANVLLSPVSDNDDDEYNERFPFAIPSTSMPPSPLLDTTNTKPSFTSPSSTTFQTQTPSTQQKQQLHIDTTTPTQPQPQTQTFTYTLYPTATSPEQHLNPPPRKVQLTSPPPSPYLGFQQKPEDPPDEITMTDPESLKHILYQPATGILTSPTRSPKSDDELVLSPLGLDDNGAGNGNGAGLGLCLEKVFMDDPVITLQRGDDEDLNGFKTHLIRSLS